MKLVDLLGLAAATLTTGCFVPQVVRLWRTRRNFWQRVRIFSMSAESPLVPGLQWFRSKKRCAGWFRFCAPCML